MAEKVKKKRFTRAVVGGSTWQLSISIVWDNRWVSCWRKPAIWLNLGRRIWVIDLR